MDLWSFPGTVSDILGPSTFAAELDLGCKWYHPCSIHIASCRPRTTDKLRTLITPGTRIVAVAGHITGDTPLRAHVHLRDGTNLAAALTGRTTPPPPEAPHGGGFDKVWRYPATALRVLDGDTITARLNLGVATRYVNGVRVQHINTPEGDTPAGVDATTYARTILPAGTPVTVTSHRLEKYGRVLGDLLLPDGHDYGTALRNAGHATAYNGGKR